MTKISVLIRVYDRLEDLKYCLEIIKKTWTSFEYFIVIVSNGKDSGFVVEEHIKDQVDALIELEHNAGHLKGNAQLLQEGLHYIPKDTDYTIILEADTWIYEDKLIKKYITRLQQRNAVWASANWYSHLYSLATDFAIIDAGFLRANPEIFSYTGYPECHAANYLLDRNSKFVFITENMPVHLPSYIKKFPFAVGIRFNVFPNGKMVSHHVELLKDGMQRKKQLFNTLAETGFFKGDELKPDRLLKFKITASIGLSRLFPVKGWAGKYRLKTTVK